MNNKRRMIIVGAGGHAKVCAEIARLNGYEDIVYLDDNRELLNTKQFLGMVSGKVKDFEDYDGDFFIAIGDSAIRGKLLKEVSLKNKNVVSLIHPNAVVSEYAVIGAGVVVMAGAVVNPTSVVEDGSIINTCSSVDHDCHIGSNSHVAVGAHLCGNVEIGNNCWIGAGSTIINNVQITHNVIVGAGALVLNDISEPGTYIGVPVNRMTDKRK